VVAAAPLTVSLEQVGKISEGSPIPLYFQLIQLLEEKIRSGDWKPGSTLPSEQMFCEHFGLSRTVVRQAFADLEQKGLIKKQNGKKTTVAYPAYRGTLMQNLAGFHEEAERKGEKASTRVMEFKVIAAEGIVAEKLGLSAGEKVILLTRLRFLGEQPQVFVKTYLNYRLCASIMQEDFSSQSLYRVLQQKLGLVIVKGVRSIKAIALNSRESDLLEVKRHSPALLLESIGFLADGTPLEFFVAKHRGDRSAFEVQLVG